ncbi:hypothetical protein D5086_010331 [Populus alba]|uniref:Uncharacterized protein n=1 Tax=Populus alba TaxID=43335 RepID=A0ACC4CAJ0_POPAL
MRAYIISSVMDKNQDHRSMNSSDLKDKGQVPSTRVRQALAIGDVKYVSELLVHRHRLISTVGDQKELTKTSRGWSISFPKSYLSNPREGKGIRINKDFLLISGWNIQLGYSRNHSRFASHPLPFLPRTASSPFRKSLLILDCCYIGLCAYERFSSCLFNMSSLSGMLQRPVIAAAAAALASVSVDFSDKLQSFRSFDSCSTSEQSSSLLSNSVQDSNFSWVSHSSVSKLASLSFVTRIQIPVPKLNFAVLDVSQNFVPSTLGFSVASSPLLVSLYQSAELAKGPKPSAFKTTNIPTSSPDILYRWHLPEPSTIDVSGSSDCLSEKSRTVVVLLGWLGSKQKHLKKYAEWYTSRGFHVITFTFPMAEILCYQVGGKAEQDIDLLVNHLTDWLEEDRKNLVFHTFSNTGWLTYGVILEKFQKQDPSLMGRIRGCIVDSAPVAAPDPQVWASGFSAAFLKNHSIATRVHMSSKEPDSEALVGSKTHVEPKPAITESALLAILEKFFDVILNLPTVNRRLSEVLSLLSSGQPSCPQLYIYSSADRVIPAGSVESFIEEQRRAGREVRACNFVFTPHVDHFRNDPKLYATQLSQFLDDYVLTRCKCS